MYIHTMEKVVKITTLKEQTTDFAYWATKSPTERLEAVELLRQQYFSFNKNVQPRLQRVCRVIKQS